MDAIDRIQEQFGRNAGKYATSQVHAQGESLGRLVELAQPQAQWLALDVATGAGHTALAFAPLVRHVWAVDLTMPMLLVTRKLARERGLSHVSLAQMEAAHFPFPEESFDLITCRIAPHHFEDVAGFVREAARTLRPGGKLAVADNIAPGSRLRGKKGKREGDAGIYVNAIEKLRDPSHNRCLSLDEWLEFFQQAGLDSIQYETLSKRIEFDEWAARMGVAGADLTRLRVLFAQAPAAAAEFLQPRFTGNRLDFLLWEVVIVGTKS